MSARGFLKGLAIVLVVLVFAGPLVFMVMGSLRAPGLPPPDGFEFVPEYARWQNYSDIPLIIPINTYVRNSMLVVAIAVPLTVLVASWAGFVIVAGSRVLRRLVLVVTLFALMIPVTALWVPRFVLYDQLGLTDTLVPLILPALIATSPFFVLIFALVYSRIPRELFEAAESEGLTPFGMWRLIAWPLGRAAVFAVAVLAFAAHWSSFMEPLLYLAEGELFTLPLGLRALHVMEPTKHPYLLAASLLACIPVVAVFLVTQRVLFRRVLEV